MNGEIGCKIIKVGSDPGFVRPRIYDYVYLTKDVSNDLDIYTDNGDCFHICGNNDWAFLALDLLKPIKEEAQKLVEKAQKCKELNPNIYGFVVGVNDKRILDVYFGGKDKCDKLLGLPIITNNEGNYFGTLLESEC